MLICNICSRKDPRDAAIHHLLLSYSALFLQSKGADISCLLFCKSKGLRVVDGGLNLEMMIITLFCYREKWPNKYAMLIIIQMIVIAYIFTGLPYFSSTVNLWFQWLHTPSYAGINTVILFSMLTHLCISFDHDNQRGKYCYPQFNQGRNRVRIIFSGYKAGLYTYVILCKIQSLFLSPNLHLIDRKRGRNRSCVPCKLPVPPHGQKSRWWVQGHSQWNLTQSLCMDGKSNPFPKAGLLEKASVDTFSVGFVMLVSVGPESRQPGPRQDDWAKGRSVHTQGTRVFH